MDPKFLYNNDYLSIFNTHYGYTMNQKGRFQAIIDRFTLFNLVSGVKEIGKNIFT